MNLVASALLRSPRAPWRAVVMVCALLTTAPAFSAHAASPQALYQALLSERAPTSASVKAVDPGSAATREGLVGEVDLTFQAADPKARLAYFVFADSTAAGEFNRKHLPGVMPGQKLLAYPPMARCADVAGAGGYCDMWVQQYGVIMVASASKVAGGADALMGIGFKHLAGVYQRLASQPAPPPTPGGLDPCALVTKGEAEVALNQSVGPPQRDRVGGCYWPTRGADGLSVQAFDTGRAGFQAGKSRASGRLPLPGIGDDAFGFVSLAGFVQISLIKNGHYVALTLQSQRDPAKLEKAKALAAKIAGRL